MRLIRQTMPSECGLCVISMIATHFGFFETINYYRLKYHLGRDGINLNDMTEIFRKIGINSKIFAPERLSDFEFKKAPYVIYFDKHFVVLKSINKSKAVIYDPAKGKYILSFAQLETSYAGKIIEVEKAAEFKIRKQNISEFKNIFKILFSVKKIIASASVISVVSYTISLLIPLLLTEIINFIVANNELNDFKIFLQVGFIILFFIVTSIFRNKKILKFQCCLNDKLALDVMEHIFKIPYKYFEDRSSSGVHLRLNFLNNVRDVISGNAMKVVVSITGALVVFIYFCVFYPHLVSALFVATVLIVFYIVVSNEYLIETTKKQISAQEKINNTQFEIIHGIFQVKCMNLSKYFFELYKTNFKSFQETFAKNQLKLNMFNLVISSFDMFMPVVLVIFIAAFHYATTPTPGHLLTIYLILQLYLKLINDLLSSLSQIYRLKVSLAYINDLSDEPEEEDFGEKDVDEFSELSVRNVMFRYNENQKNVLNSVDFKLSKGQKIAIVGLSGSGKTTLVKLLTRLYFPSDGKIVINKEHLLKDISEESYSKLFSTVPQQPIVFNKSIKENLTLSNTSISDEEINEVLKVASLWDDINNMPLGINTIVSGQGGNLSGGQIQRITLARALMTKPQVLILDEATSSLDVKNETQIYENLKKKGISIIVISHRLTTISDSDKIYYLHDGSFVEEGTHDELIAKEMYYHYLFKMCK